MSTAAAPVGSSWVPPSCTLPNPDRRLRLQQFDQLFADAVTAVERSGPATALDALTERAWVISSDGTRASTDDSSTNSPTRS